MPNFKIIQDQPDEARVKVYGSNNAALLQDAENKLVVTSSLAITDVTYTTPASVAGGAGSALTTPAQNVLALSEWSWIAYNTSEVATALAEVKMQGSPDGSVWTDNSSYVTVTQNTIATMVPSRFLKYSRVYYSPAGSTAVSLSFFFQGQG
ncbi:MAG: hypothetical protein H6Q68_2339 [Firmicutes bacterium]|nr:hypothetical protein [Bacillota bacterium]